MRAATLLWTLVLCVSLLVTIPCMAQSPAVISGNPNLPPISWEKRGNLLGVGPRLAEKVLSELGVTFTITPAGSWQEVQEQCAAGKIDMIVAAYENSERLATMAFSRPFMQSPVVIVVRKGQGFPVTSWKSLQGKKGVAHTGESFGEKFDSYIRRELDVTYLSYEQAVNRLAEGTADYLIIDLYPAIIYTKLLQAEDKVEFLAKPVTVQQLRLAICRQSSLLRRLPQINEVLQRLVEERYIRQLVLDQYSYWNTTLAERDRFLARQKRFSSQQQATYQATSRDRGMERLLRFLDQEGPYLNASGLNVD